MTDLNNQNNQDLLPSFNILTDFIEVSREYEIRLKDYWICIERLKHVFHLPLPQAAKVLNIPVYLIKRQCRKLGIRRWPHWQNGKMVREPTKNEIIASFKLHMCQAAFRFGYSESGFRKVCRKYGIKRWGKC